MKKKKTLARIGIAVCAVTFFIGSSSRNVIAFQAPPPQGGGPLPGLNPASLNAFNQGSLAFRQRETPADGLGPVFNGESCVQCHNQGAVGGAGSDFVLSTVTRIGGMKNGVYSDLVEVGGPVIQARSNREFNPRFPHGREVVPPGTQFVSRRITTPLFGAGLIEAIPGATITARTFVRLPDGIAGIANIVYNPETKRSEVGRFGWKSQVSSLSVFAADAYLNEMGVTTPLFPKENLPQGLPIARGADPVGDPEDATDVVAFTNFMRFLAPPVRRPSSFTVARGEQFFNQVGCNNCHVASMNTGPNTNPALANKQVVLYSDLLVHRMGASLADGIIQGNAKGDMFRTAPLWGMGMRRFLLHDGRATTPEQAINFHGGEAEASKNRYFLLLPQDKLAVQDFLRSL